MQIGSGQMGSNAGEAGRRPDDIYWASVPKEELGAQVVSRYREWGKHLQASGWLGLVQKCERTYYGYDPQTGAVADNVLPAGEEGELLAVHVNQFRAFLKHQLVLATANRLHVQAIATNDSAQSASQAVLGTQIARWYLERGGLERTAKASLERALVCGAGYITQLWDVHAGPESGVEPERVLADGETVQPERVMRAGDVSMVVYGPEDVARDVGLRSHADARWFIIRERCDKWEEAARYPEHRAHILAQARYDRDDLSIWELGTMNENAAGDTDQIHRLRLLHAKCDALPNGREAVIIGGEVIWSADDLPYERLPVIPVLPEEIFDTAMGYSSNWDLLGPQQAYNGAADAALSAQDAGSTATWTAPRTSNVAAEDIGSGRLLRYDVNPGAPNGGAPAMMQMPQPSDSSLKMVEMWERIMGTLSGINATVRGEAEGSSGADNALLQAQAVQYNAPLGTAYADTVEALCLGVIECLRRFASDERTLQVVGEDEQPLMARFRGEHLAEVAAISVEVGNPLMRSMQGRKALADQMLEAWPTQVGPQEWLTFLDTGRLEPLWKAARNEVILVRSENASMSRGQVVPVLLADNHECHIREHLGLLSSPTARTDANLANLVMGHIQAHAMAWQEVAATMPSILAATGQRPPPPPAGPMGMGAPPPPAPGPDGAPPPPDAGGPPGVAGVDESELGADLPSMPNNPMTGEPAEVAGAEGAMQ
jgi:hypothetical protein